MRLLAVVLGLSSFAAAADAPVVFYSKSFPGSAPAYVQLTLARDGSAVYMEDPKDDQPLKFQLTPAETGQIFDLAAKLDNFKRPLESGLKVARMGVKTYRYQNGAEKHEQSFNYSTDETARLLQDWFERIVESERRFIDLDRAIHFDRIGVNESLLNMAVVYEQHRLIAPEQFLPLLDRIAKNESFVHMARERAASIADTIRAGQPPKTE